MARKIIAGNWKMNHTFKEGTKLIEALHRFYNSENPQHVEVVIAPPFIHIPMGATLSANSRVTIAGQNCSEHEAGAYTGEVSAAMLASAGAEAVIIGHSERRALFNESNDQLKAKLKQSWANGLMPIFCVGEQLEQRQANKHFDTVKAQIDGVLAHFDADTLENLIIAYEPVWAIGTGEVATAEQAQEMHSFIRKHLAEKYHAVLADEISLLYGGSLKPANAKELFSQPDVDGGLIGGASLNYDSFTELIKIGEEVLR